jgi:uncharacterized membrane protein YtjA (UPF0391 family)
MLRLSLFFFLLAMIAGLFGFTGIAGASIAVAKVLFFVFLFIWLFLLALGVTIFRSVT